MTEVSIFPKTQSTNYFKDVFKHIFFTFDACCTSDCDRSRPWFLHSDTTAPLTSGCRWMKPTSLIPLFCHKGSCVRGRAERNVKDDTFPRQQSQSKQPVAALSSQIRKNCFTFMNFAQSVEVGVIAAGIIDTLRNQTDVQTSGLLSYNTSNNLVSLQQTDNVYSPRGTYTTHIPVMVKTGRLTGRIIHRDMTATCRGKPTETWGTPVRPSKQDHYLPAQLFHHISF